MEPSIKVIIRCLVYNHEPYLRDCLDGFVMQKTNFPFKAVVHDDCSTDGSASILREYAEKYPDIIEPIYETENLYSKRDGSLGRVMAKACNGRSKYFALCEGDDYWIDPYKLQKQVDYMDSHPECTMTYTNVYVDTQQGRLYRAEQEKLWGEIRCDDSIVDTEYVISQCAATIHTCSLLFKANLRDDFPAAAARCYVGDYPLEIFAALKGYLYGFSDVTAVYRYQVPGAWSSQQNCEKSQTLLANWLTVVEMHKAMDEYSGGKYHLCFVKESINLVAGLLLSKPSLIYDACEINRYVTLFSYKHCSPVLTVDGIGWIKKLILKIKYYPFYPFYSPICKLVSTLTLWQRIKIAWQYMCNQLK